MGQCSGTISKSIVLQSQNYVTIAASQQAKDLVLTPLRNTFIGTWEKQTKTRQYLPQSVCSLGTSENPCTTAEQNDKKLQT